MPGQAPQICLGWVRTNPWLSRNAQEPRHPHTWLAPGGGKMGLRDPQNLTPSPVPAASNYSKHSPAFTCAQTPCGAWDPAGCCCSKTRKAGADALPVLSCIGSPGGGRTGKAGEHLQSSANVWKLGFATYCRQLAGTGRRGGEGK